MCFCSQTKSSLMHLSLCFIKAHRYEKKNKHASITIVLWFYTFAKRTLKEVPVGIIKQYEFFYLKLLYGHVILGQLTWDAKVVCIGKCFLDKTCPLLGNLSNYILTISGQHLSRTKYDRCQKLREGLISHIQYIVNARTKLAFSETLTFAGIHLMFYLKAAIIKHFKISETRVLVILVTTWNFPWLCKSCSMLLNIIDAHQTCKS